MPGCNRDCSILPLHRLILAASSTSSGLWSRDSYVAVHLLLIREQSIALESPEFAQTKWLLDRKQKTQVVPLNITSVLVSLSSLSWVTSKASVRFLSRTSGLLTNQASAVGGWFACFSELFSRLWSPPPLRPAILGKKPLFTWFPVAFGFFLFTILLF